MAESLSHVLQDEAQLEAITKRLKRANGQMTAVIRMLEEGRNCEEIITQMAAVNKAVQEKLQKLFLTLA